MSHRKECRIAEQSFPPSSVMGVEVRGQENVCPKDIAYIRSRKGRASQNKEPGKENPPDPA